MLGKRRPRHRLQPLVLMPSLRGMHQLDREYVTSVSDALSDCSFRLTEILDESNQRYPLSFFIRQRRYISTTSKFAASQPSSGRAITCLTNNILGC